MSVTAILLPVFVLVLLPFVLLMGLGARRWEEVRAGSVDRDKAAIDDATAWPVNVRQAANAFRNQFELPVLFYVLAILVLVTRQAGFIYLVLAWIFVISRWIHAGIHVGPNVVGPRFAVFAVGVVALIGLWISFALSILFSPMVP